MTKYTKFIQRNYNYQIKEQSKKLHMIYKIKFKDCYLRKVEVLISLYKLEEIVNY